jgi:hypothetical protein
MTTAFAADRYHGNLASGEHLTSNIDFYTLNTLCVLNEADVSVADAGQDNLVRLGEIIGIQAQPVMTGLHVISGVNLTLAANQTLYGITGSVLTSATVYQLKFAIEHTGAWSSSDLTGTVPGTLAYAMVNETAMVQFTFGTETQILIPTNSALMFSAIL